MQTFSQTTEAQIHQAPVFTRVPAAWGCKVGWEAARLQVFPQDPTDNPMAETQFVMNAGGGSQQEE